MTDQLPSSIIIEQMIIERTQPPDSTIMSLFKGVKILFGAQTVETSLLRDCKFEDYKKQIKGATIDDLKVLRRCIALIETWPKEFWETERITMRMLPQTIRLLVERFPTYNFYRVDNLVRFYGYRVMQDLPKHPAITHGRVRILKLSADYDNIYDPDDDSDEFD